MDKFTETTIYMLMYRCFKNEILIDEYTIGYFVSKQEAYQCVWNDIHACGNTSIKVEKYAISGIDKDPKYRHEYYLHKVNVGKTIQHDSITPLTSWDF